MEAESLPQAPTTKEAILEFIAANKVVVFSGTYCPYCRKAKNILTTKKVAFEAIEVDVVTDGDKIMPIL